MKRFLRHFFLALGVLWFLSALAILSFKLNFKQFELSMILAAGFVYALIRYYEFKYKEEISQKTESN